MKKINYLFVFIFIIFSFILSACSSSNDNELELNNEAIEENSEEVLDMQSFSLKIPDNYNCSGGFVDGYRYQEARCLNNNRSDYEIIVDYGLAVSGIDPEKGLVSNQLVARSFEFTDGVYGLIVCQEHFSENLNLNAEHYLCFHNIDETPAITMGVGKSYSNYGRWFEANLLIQEETDYNQADYIEILEKFLNQSIIIDWEEYRNE